IGESDAGPASGAATNVATFGESARLNCCLEKIAVGNANTLRSGGCIADYVSIGERQYNGIYVRFPLVPLRKRAVTLLRRNSAMHLGLQRHVGRAHV